ncbi:MAG: hypothetical protein GF365_01060 [Candidatus Buchananbacteria bacterium]|nr:hypothetical protein [Candidatus Buchananbacteria bacterium]
MDSNTDTLLDELINSFVVCKGKYYKFSERRFGSGRLCKLHPLENTFQRDEKGKKYKLIKNKFIWVDFTQIEFLSELPENIQLIEEEK